MHAAGVVIGDKPLWEYVPCFRPAGEDGHRHPVRQGRGREGRPGEVRLPRPQDADRHPTCLDLRQPRERSAGEAPLDLALHPARRRARLQDDLRRPTPPACSSSSRRGFRELLKKLKPDCFEDIIAAGALYRPGPLEGGMVDDFIDRKHGRKKVDVRRTRRSSRSSRTPTASSSTRSRSCRSPRRWPATRSARPTFFAAPWARRRRRSWPRRRPASSTAPRRRSVDRKIAERDLRPDGEVRRLRLQQVALGRLRPAHLPDRVPQALLPGRVLRGAAHLRQGRHRQGREVHRRGARPAASRCCRPTSTSRTPTSASSCVGDERQRQEGDPLRPRRGEGRGRGRGRGRSRQARDAGRAVPVAVRLLPARRRAQGEPQGARGAGEGGRLRRRRRSRTASRARECSARSASPASAPPRRSASARAARPTCWRCSAAAAATASSGNGAGARRGQVPRRRRVDAEGAARLREGGARLLHQRPPARPLRSARSAASPTPPPPTAPRRASAPR